ncbi:Pro-kumamolisin, activation domain [Leifsonia sp. 98AMF]|uniref:S53 family peptidase n=1 Tax=unclassified Leifsonia TaxID=2663824 RepID=UPI00087C3BCD|nr:MULTISPECIES: S53 family peptidase [unclassified Leifsonia]SDH28983.1 Pro-kumamolisin, activation domain [Leifsonia sp. 197AMF]SDJ08942.1 Pro-kumamolisin, activation domain [Leifsonia sp. 466MF]SDJ61928.1 Pro-kumamolisin, activation domain [Leifsonia sp. 157MF]SDN30078.1 Pro-kumamolisin, activation domain [Leifsonia sp. 509MF]SEM91072.1 Pro-kumamolisin, activation domain [Leifsonia sp. 467MF]
MRTSTRTLRAAAVTAGAALLFVAAAATPAAAASGRSALPGSQPAWANAKALRSAAPATDTVDLRVYLPWQNASAAAQTALAVSTPGSSSYRKFLTPQAFRQQFAPSQSSVVAVQQFLRSAGFTIVDTPSNNRYVSAEGTVAQAQNAFGVTLGEYSAYGTTLRAPESAVTVPASLAGIVESVAGLDQGASLIQPTSTDGYGNGNSPKQNHGAPSVGFRAGQPCSLWYGEKTVAMPNAPAYGTSTKPIAPCGYTPAQVRGLYGLDQVAANGSGQTVAFVGANASPTLVQDVTKYSSLHNLPAPKITQLVAPGVYKHPDTPQQVPGDYYGEETLDAEAIHTTAPGADLLYVASANARQDFDASVNHIVDKHLASILSISYGFAGEAVPQGFVNSLNNTFIEAAATGVGVFVSSGDSGDEVGSFGTPTVDFYADSPWVTAVGGSSASVVPTAAPSGLSYSAIDDPASPLNNTGWKRSFEVGWETGLDAVNPTATDHMSGAPYELDGTLASPLPGTFNGGGGGGVSRLFAQPAYQAAAVGAASGRLVPDISALADPNTGLLVGQTQTFSNGTYYDEYRIGGTSVAAPLTAGIAAVANQVAGAPLGFLNPRIYAAYAAGGSAFYDVDQADMFGTTVQSPLPSVLRVNYVDSESAAGGLSYSLRTQEEPNQTLHSTKGYDTATGVGTPNGAAFFAGITK